MKLFMFLSAFVMCSVFAEICYSEQDVNVLNFPEKQLVEDVNYQPKTNLIPIERVDVGTFTTLEVMDLSKKYLLNTMGYSKASLSFFGFPKAKNFDKCQVGIVLLPNTDATLRAYSEDRKMIFASQVSTNISDNEKYFEGQVEVDLHFPEYIVGFYNTCSTNVEISLYAYLK